MPVPFADLVATNVQAPTRTIGDPAEVTISWTVANAGIGVGLTTTWTDAVIVSTNTTVGDVDDIILAEFQHTGDLDVGQSYTRTETFLLPPAFTGRFNLFVKTDANEEVFENGQENNNTATSAQLFDVMPVPFADLVVTSITPAAVGFGGQPLEITWTVENQGIGLTNLLKK